MPTNFLTKDGFQKLQEELDHLRTQKPQEVASRLHEAMEGGELYTDCSGWSGVYEPCIKEGSKMEEKKKSADEIMLDRMKETESGDHV